MVHSSSSMDYGTPCEIQTDSWLRANGHSREWLERWLDEPQLDKAAITEWLTIHKRSDPRLIVRRRIK